jgi:hypothetical protein
MTIEIPLFLKRKTIQKSISETIPNRPAEYEPSPNMLPRPFEATWKTAKLYRVYFSDTRWPVSGQRMVWAVVGRKWVRVVTPITKTKFKMRRSEWDNITDKEMIRE